MPFITENVIETISTLRNEQGKDILIDEMQICYVPVILGKGIPLFPEQPKESKWTLRSSKVYDSGILRADYQGKN
ncbi:dihydrofolate reductase family protein [Proteiniphilum sp.]|uniref:dihydrofolate reductase family protein n=1 Tax=Proteiniphilum sp. TaxID=1926877 RepID=UPI002B21C2F3|nr:dihydrofolate reductase family protein [Proteiniphilum sp.]MEA4918480.1 dihydrofolate reductase family protein [Proteiniphilum sp.]